MRARRRDLLAASAALFATTGLSGCRARAPDGPADGEPGGPATENPEVAPAVAAEWSASRARAWDALALGLAGDPGDGARIAEDTFSRFEGAGGEYGAHEYYCVPHEAAGMVGVAVVE